MDGRTDNYHINILIITYTFIPLWSASLLALSCYSAVPCIVAKMFREKLEKKNFTIMSLPGTVLSWKKKCSHYMFAIHIVHLVPGRRLHVFEVHFTMEKGYLFANTAGGKEQPIITGRAAKLKMSEE